MLTLRLHRCFICAIALVGGFQQPRHRCVPATRRSMMRDDERLFVGDAGMIVAAGATQKLVESFAAGDSILSPVTASDLDALPALFFSSGVWLLCWLVPATYRGVYDDAVCLRRPSKGIQSRTAVTADPAGERRRASARARRGSKRRTIARALRARADIPPADADGRRRRRDRHCQRRRVPRGVAGALGVQIQRV